MKFRSGALMLAILFTSLAGTGESGGIVIRHDRDDSLYRERAAAYPAAVSIRPDGTGVLVAPRWVLTAAHVARSLQHRAGTVEAGGKEYPVEGVVLHPDWQRMGAHDVALLRLAEPVEGIEPVLLYPGDDEVGQVVTFVGAGDTGTGLTGPKAQDRIRRAATNRVEDADDDWIFFTFHAPDSGDATPLEGVSGPGDSGGPAFIEKDGKLFTAGVSVFADGKGKGPGRYGVLEGYTRVSTHREWIEKTIAGPAPLAGATPPSDGSPASRR